MRAVGIDLGTANSIMACVNADAHSEMIGNRDGKLHTASVVLFDDQRTIVGAEARLRSRNQPYRLAACAKQDLGKRFYSQAIGGTYLPPEVIQACILRQLNDDVSLQLGPDFAVVIGVPAYFNDLQRRATAEAAEMAGLRLLDVLNEPVAAALAFSEYSPQHSLGSRPAASGHVLVYDLGGYSFEATLLRCEGESFATLATDRDNNLGGNDWDLKLADYLAEQFQAQHQIDLRAEPAGLELLFTFASRAKLALGLRPTTTVMVPRNGVPRTVVVTRSELERISSTLLEQTRMHTERLLSNAGLSWSDVSRILLVGGATRMPMVRSMLHRQSGLMPDQRVSPDEAVCRGAALYASRLLNQRGRNGSPMGVRVGNISTHSLGIEGVELKSGKKMNKVLIPRGTPLPARVTKEFVTKANAQQSISITILEGDSSQPEHCVAIGRAVLRDLPAEMTTQWPVEVTCEYGVNGRLTLEARIRYTDRMVHLEVLRPCGVSQIHLDRWKTAVCQRAGFSAFQDLARRERQEESPPPIAMAVSPPEEHAHEGHRVLSLLHRYLPFVFRRSEQPEGSHVP
jgi:molecular chaperone DnaK